MGSSSWKRLIPAAPTTDAFPHEHHKACDVGPLAAWSMEGLPIPSKMPTYSSGAMSIMREGYFAPAGSSKSKIISLSLAELQAVLHLNVAVACKQLGVCESTVRLALVAAAGQGAKWPARQVAPLKELQEEMAAVPNALRRHMPGTVSRDYGF